MAGACRMGERGHLGDLGVEGRLLRWIFKKWDEGHRLD